MTYDETHRHAYIHVGTSFPCESRAHVIHFWNVIEPLLERRHAVAARAYTAVELKLCVQAVGVVDFCIELVFFR